MVEVDRERGRVGLRLADDPDIAGKSAEELAGVGTGDKGGRPAAASGGGRGRGGDRGGRGGDRDNGGGDRTDRGDSRPERSD